MEQVEDIRHTTGSREIYKKRKETIERVFADAKGKHAMRYTQYKGLVKVKMELNLLLCMHELKTHGELEMEKDSLNALIEAEHGYFLLSYLPKLRSHL